MSRKLIFVARITRMVIQYAHRSWRSTYVLITMYWLYSKFILSIIQSLLFTLQCIFSERTKRLHYLVDHTFAEKYIMSINDQRHIHGIMYNKAIIYNVNDKIHQHIIATREFEGIWDQKSPLWHRRESFVFVLNTHYDILCLLKSFGQGALMLRILKRKISITRAVFPCKHLL